SVSNPPQRHNTEKGQRAALTFFRVSGWADLVSARRILAAHSDPPTQLNRLQAGLRSFRRAAAPFQIRPPNQKKPAG
ncbi:MAG: hypothetical protein EA428_01210, partial [Spirochaetaceae bacterium]